MRQLGSISIAAGKRLYAYEAQINAHAILGAGTLEVLGHGDSADLQANLDLADVHANIDLTQVRLSVDESTNRLTNVLNNNDSYDVSLPELDGNTLSLRVEQLDNPLGLR